MDVPELAAREVKLNTHPACVRWWRGGRRLQVTAGEVSTELAALLKRTGDFRTPEQFCRRLGVTLKQLTDLVNLKEVRGTCFFLFQASLVVEGLVDLKEGREQGRGACDRVLGASRAWVRRASGARAARC